MAWSAGAFTKNDPSASTGAVPIATALTGCVLRLQPDRAGVALQRAVARNARIQRQQVCVVPVVQCGRMSPGPLARRKHAPARPGCRRLRASTVSSDGSSLASTAFSANFAAAESRALTSHAPEAVSAIAARVIGTWSSDPLFMRQRRSKSRQRRTVREHHIAGCELLAAPAPALARWRDDRSDTTPRPSHRNTPETAPASCSDTKRKSGFEQDAPIRQHIRRDRARARYVSGRIARDPAGSISSNAFESTSRADCS